ncbi:thiol reductant ABC exporter subunit CydC [Paradesulfitobacterium ferrireducens]|uniref:thiol reductant ABC exporter subunit CydC n=1 Tax=Paradesulfitobacterium ferrireducens TaxID=2816476 RepID=UPI001A8E5B5B|nr:thiol reductant ABC exporter subunit CydC [Paradesulfitobacterium ferrireducens]
MGALRRLLLLLLPNLPGLSGALFFAFCTVAGNIGLMATSAYLISRAALHPPILDLMVAIVGVRFFGISRGLWRYGERYFSHDVTFRSLARLRVAFFKALEPLAPARLLSYHSGDLFSRIIADVEREQYFFLRVLLPPVVALTVLVVYTLFLSFFAPSLAGVFIFFFLLAGLGLPLLVDLVLQNTARRLVTLKGTYQSRLAELFRGLGDVLVYGEMEAQQALLRLLNREILNLETRGARYVGLGSALNGLLMNLALWSVLVVAIPLVGSGKLNGVYVAMLALGTVSAFEAVLPLPGWGQHLRESKAAAERLAEIMGAEASDRQGSESEAGAQKKINAFGGAPSLVFEELYFRYAPEQPWVLTDVSCTLPPGSKIALIGPSGAGKSTMVHLLLRFWDYERGRITLNGQDLREFAPDEVRKLFSVVSQDTHLFHATIRENLLLAKLTADQAELERAAMKAKLHEFIAGLPEGYDTYVGEEGFKLSGGQRQRLAIARALLRDAPILVLDEATSGLDAEQEKAVLQEIFELFAGKTIIMITHHVLGLPETDRILVLQEGSVVEEGTPGELWQKNGLYRRMVERGL